MTYFQRTWINNIQPAKHRQTIVFGVNGSFTIKWDSKAKTIAPTANPINLPGQTCPLKDKAQYFVK